MALVSDAGTPLVSDPGYRLVAAAHEAGFRVSPVPGPCAAIAALSVCGLATDRFVFEGFLPSRRGARRARLEVLADEPRTMVFFEAARRLQDALDDMADIFGAGREAALARELTKRFETVRRASLGALAVWVGEDAEQRRGEVVIAVAGCPGEDVDHRDEVDRALRVLLEELPTRQAVDLVSRLLDAPRNLVYQRALALEKVR